MIQNASVAGHGLLAESVTHLTHPTSLLAGDRRHGSSLADEHAPGSRAPARSLDPRVGLLHVPAVLRNHHRGPHLRLLRRPNALLPDAGLHGTLAPRFN